MRSTLSHRIDGWRHALVALGLLFGGGASAWAADETTSYVDAIAAAGGSIAAADRTAVAAFVASAKSHGYWDHLLDVGPLAGDQLAAALVKLKVPSGGSPTLVNHGFQAGDYARVGGLRGGAGRWLDSRTNLARLTSGIGGMSFWLADPAPAMAALIGLGNDATPYCLLQAQPAAGLFGNGAAGSYASAYGAFGTHGLHHVIKQRLDSLKLVIDGHVVATSDVATAATSRDGDIGVFAAAGGAMPLEATGCFYAIDDGGLTDDQIALFAADVRDLQYALGREVAPPAMAPIAGTYTAAQTVTLTALAGATIRYTTDGTAPTSASPVYAGPFVVASTARVQAIAERNGRQSTVASGYIAIVPPSFATARYYTAHVMINLLSFTDDMDGWLTEMKRSGYNLIWAHLDDYKDSYPPTLDRLMTAAERVGGIAIMPGPSWWVDPTLVAQMYQDTWNRPSLFRIDGKRVYTGWDYRPVNAAALKTQLDALGYTKDQYLLWVHSASPYTWDGGATFVGEHLDHGDIVFSTSSYIQDEPSLDHLYDVRPQFDGVINFAVDLGWPSPWTQEALRDRALHANDVLASVSRRRGKFSMAGVSAFYASASFHDFGFKLTADLWNAILAAPIGQRPNGVSDTTANDYAELSYMSPMGRPPEDGLGYVVPLSAGWGLGPNIRTPMLDHSGIQRFLRPWVDAFLQDRATPSFTADRMFAWYYLHPREQAPDATIPHELAGIPWLTQAWYDQTVYATGAPQSWATASFDGTQVVPGLGRIRMAAHLTAPSQLRINDTLSDVFPAGPAYFDIPLGTFRGTPRFAIVRSGAAVRSGSGPQPIVDHIWPGGWNFLAVEIAAEPADTVAPTVSITAPTAGATISGTITLAATAADDRGAVSVRFAVDGVAVGSTVSAPPFEMTWDPAAVTDGTHALMAVARDAAGNSTSSTPVIVVVAHGSSGSGTTTAGGGTAGATGGGSTGGTGAGAGGGGHGRGCGAGGAAAVAVAGLLLALRVVGARRR